VTGLVLVVAWVLLAYGSAAWQGFYNGLDIARVSASLLLLTAVLFGRRTLRGRLGGAALAVAFAAAAWGQVRYPSGYHASGDWLTTSRAIAVVATLLAASWVVVPLRGYRSRIWIPVTALMVVAGICMILASPQPEIDVWYVVDQAVERTLRFGNAYDMTFVGSPGDTDAYPYLPATLILLAPFKLLFGDVRYGYVAALAIGAFFVRRTARPAVGGALACLLLLYPRMLFGIEQVWTEPLLVAGLAATVYLTLSGRTRWAVVAFTVVLATKQHMFLLVPLAAWWPAFGVRRTAASVAGAAAACLPWFIADPAGFWYGAGSYNFSLASRFDSMSIYTTLDNLGWKPPFLLVLVLSLGAIPLAMWRLPRDELGFVFGSAWVLFVFNWLNKQTFFNHYSLVLALLVIGLAVRDRAAATTVPAAEQTFAEAVA
jgi:hypothetical protein